ncbi:MAG: helix-turn-helix transcriptional regulator [Solimonas sp.]
MRQDVYRTAEITVPKADRLWPDGEMPSATSAQGAGLLPMYEAGRVVRAGSLYRDGMHVDLQWHFHDMHKLLYAFEGAIEVESTRGRNVVPRQLAAWIPAGVPHCTSIHGIRWVSVFFPAWMLDDREGRVRTVTVSPLMREMMKEAMRWRVDGADSAMRAAFFEAMAQLCSEWITHEAQLFLPASSDTRVTRVLEHTARHMDLRLEDICQHAGISVRSLRRHLKAETGMTWEAFRHRSRLLQAISLLGETDEPVSEIAARCGFESPSAFAKVFRTEMGETPRDYRGRVRDPALNR